MKSASASADSCTRMPNYREVEPDYLKTLIRDQVGQYLYTKTKRRPMILPVIIEI